ncbi:restriction endonuclease [Luteimonas yindakuii]|uniref:restriction endonuclease n=1 Tax=Luteimonas yindakuii TaxID=2565782 RepID=UPI0010A3CCBA|nr:restriction endonuclease [Luteimonas yindakuii]QCO67621.1 restriction endonuclease [Luteimonas yindakuii]
MSAVLQWVVAIAVMASVGVVGTFYVRGILMRRDETAAGMRALAAMSWREFLHLVLEAMARRGFTRVLDKEAASGDSEYTLGRGHERWLLSCKHGSAFIIGKLTVNELVSDVHMANATGGLLVTQGRIDGNARAASANQQIELLDGPTLWPEVRELLKPGQLAAICAGAAQRARQRTLMVWLVALLAGIATFVVLPAPVSTRVDTPSVAQPAPAAAVDSPATAAEDLQGDAAEEPSPEQQRRAVVTSIATLPMVDRALWTTQSTLEVHLLDDDADAAFAALCPLIVRHADIASSRIQLTPPPDSGGQVRFRQCRSY